METLRPEITGRATGFEPLAVTPRQACRLLAIGNTRLYELLAARELESYRDGRCRRITMASIRTRIASLVATSTSAKLPGGTEPRRQNRRPKSQPTT